MWERWGVAGPASRSGCDPEVAAEVQEDVWELTMSVDFGYASQQHFEHD
jgi:hypothetical protein